MNRKVRVLFLGGTGPVGSIAVPMLLADGHELVLAHSGRHPAPAPERIEQLLGERSALLEPGGPVERWAPEVIVDTFAGGATASKATELSQLAERVEVEQLIAISSIDVYRQAAEAGVDDHEVAELGRGSIPIREDAPKRQAHTSETGRAHDNVVMEAALGGAPRVTVLRPGAIYGMHAHPRVAREWFLVSKVAAGDDRLELPLGGTQLFHRVALERVGAAIAAASKRAPAGHWECNVCDPQLLSYGALARLVGAVLDWEWQIEPVDWQPDNDHPWGVRHPVVADVTRLERVLGVLEPEPEAATIAQIEWLWANRKSLAKLEFA